MKHSKSSLSQVLLCAAILPAHVFAQAPQSSAPRTLDTLTVYGESENDGIIQNPFPEAVEGQNIFSGKRATVIDLDALPKVKPTTTGKPSP